MLGFISPKMYTKEWLMYVRAYFIWFCVDSRSFCRFVYENRNFESGGLNEENEL